MRSRVLAVLSSDLSAAPGRAGGLALLEQLVQKRGGLEGEADPSFPTAEFQPFFKQIRPFLTVQEQVDLFSRWAQSGSSTADFLASHALTAAGFVQRKPERVRAAHDRLLASGQAGMEPFLACQQLLLGDIEAAESLFAQGASDELRQWAREQGDGPLAGVCAYCRDWLSREVLPGFRDIEAEADLEAWFADRDVQAYVEQQDRIRARAVAAVSRSSTPGTLDALPPSPPLPDVLPPNDTAADFPPDQAHDSRADPPRLAPSPASWPSPSLPARSAPPPRTCLPSTQRAPCRLVISVARGRLLGWPVLSAGIALRQTTPNRNTWGLTIPLHGGTNSSLIGLPQQLTSSIVSCGVSTCTAIVPYINPAQLLQQFFMPAPPPASPTTTPEPNGITSPAMAVLATSTTLAVARAMDDSQKSPTPEAFRLLIF